MGAGSYGVVYGEPGLPAIDAQGRTPILPPDQYVSKVFLDGKYFADDQAKQAADEASIKTFFQSQFPDNFDKLKEHFIIPLGDYFIDKNVLKKEWATYYNRAWRGNAPKRNRWLKEARDETPMKSQVVTEIGGLNLFKLFLQLPERVFPKNAVKGIINILEGIEMLRAKNIIHGDIKTPNALDTPSGKYKIIDLGDCTKIDTVTPQTLTFDYDNNTYTLPSGKELGGVVQMMPYTVYFIWPSVVQFFTARAFPEPNGTNGAPLTFEKFRENWLENSSAWLSNQLELQSTLVRDMMLLVKIANMRLETLFVIPGPRGDGTDAINVTGNLFLINLMNTCMLKQRPDTTFARPDQQNWFARNIRWNQPSIGSLFQRIDTFSVGVIFINCLGKWAENVVYDKIPVSDATVTYLKNVVRLIAQCCYQTPNYIIPIDQGLKEAILERPVVVPPVVAAAPVRPPTPPNAYATVVKRAATDAMAEVIDEALARNKKGGKRRRTHRKRRRGKRTKRHRRRRKRGTRRRHTQRGGWFGKNWFGTWGQKTKKTGFGWTSKNMKCNPYLPMQCPGGGRCVGTGWGIGPIKLQGKCI